MYKIRFHLGRGVNFMKWQIKEPDGKTRYLDPDGWIICAKNATLRNRKATAKKIHDGCNKTVCAWIEADTLEVHKCKGDMAIHTSMDVLGDARPVRFNPREAPHWTDMAGTDIDGTSYKDVKTFGKFVYVL